MEQINLAEWVLSGAGAVIVYIASKMATQLERLTDSVTKLNENMAVVLSTLGAHSERLDRVEKKIFKEE